MLADGTARPGLKASYPSQFSGGVATYTPNPALPIVIDPVVLDASLQPGYAGSPIIEIDGSAAGANVSGFHISAGGSTVRGFVIHSFVARPPWARASISTRPAVTRLRRTGSARTRRARPRVRLRRRTTRKGCSSTTSRATRSAERTPPTETSCPVTACAGCCWKERARRGTRSRATTSAPMPMERRPYRTPSESTSARRPTTRSAVPRTAPATWFRATASTAFTSWVTMRTATS